MCRQRFVLHKKVFMILLIGIFISSGCRQSENRKMDNDRSLTETVDIRINEETDTPFTETLPMPSAVPLNTKAEEIHYYSENDIDLLGALSRCVSDGENIYLVYGKPDLYIMPIGTDEHRPANINNPEGMELSHIALDLDGRIHLLVTNSEHEEWFIWRLDENYQIDKKIDISAYPKEKRPARWFLIDKDGTYYLQWIMDRNGIILDREGVLKHKFTRESLGTRWISEAAVGKDGQIHLVYRHSDEKLEIGTLDVKNCSIENENPTLYFPGDEVFSAMFGGTDTNLLLFSPYSGIWAYDNENGIIENRGQLSALGSDFIAEFWALTFLRDGRLILIGITVNENNADEVDGENSTHLLLKYIPVGK